MLDFIMDFLLDPALDLVLCRFDFEIWGRHQVKTFLLQIPVVLSVLLLTWGIQCGYWFLAILGLLGLLLFGYLDIKYTVWWIREGRHGSGTSFTDDIPLLEKFPDAADLLIPKGDITTTLSEEEQLRGRLEDSHRCLNSRM